MVNKAKKQGTNYETNIVNRLNKIDNFKAQRFAEGGSNDLGDIQLFIDDEEFFIEAKSRQNLNLHQTLDKAINKSGDINTLVFGRSLNVKVIMKEEVTMESLKLFQCHMNYSLNF